MPAAKKKTTAKAKADTPVGTAEGVAEAIADIAAIDQPETVETGPVALTPVEPVPAPSGPPPTLGRIVHYKSRGPLGYLAPAIVTATVDTLLPEGVESGRVAKLSAETNVHLNVFTPGSAKHYVEYDIPQASDPSDPEPGTWFWPPIV